MPYGNSALNMGQPPSTNNLWVGNNYASGYSQMSRSGYPTMQNMQNQIMNQPPQVNNILQVMGPESARAFKIGPDSQVILMDSNEPIFYIKVSDSSGYSKTKAFKFEEISFDTLEKQNNNSQKSNENYITKEDFDEYKKFIEDLVMKNG